MELFANAAAGYKDLPPTELADGAPISLPSIAVTGTKGIPLSGCSLSEAAPFRRYSDESYMYLFSHFWAIR